MKMRKGWTTTKLVAVGSLAALFFLVKTTIYISALSLSGSVFSGIIALIIGPFFTTFTALLLNQFGAATIFLLLSFIIQLPLPQLFPQLVNLASALIIGSLVDLTSISPVAKNKNLFSLVSGAIYNFINALEAIVLYFTIGLRGTENIPRFLTTFVGLIGVVVVLSIVGSLSGYSACLIYKKMSATGVAKRIQGV